jgi:hypothetical protein
VSISKPQAFASQSVQMGRWHARLVVVTPHITIPKIIGQYQQNVGGRRVRVCLPRLVSRKDLHRVQWILTEQQDGKQKSQHFQLPE